MSLVEQLGRDRRLDDVRADRIGQLVRVDVGIVLRADEDGVHASGAAVAVVLDGDLALAVGAQERQRPVAADRGQSPRDAVGEQDRHRHEGVRLVGGIAEHHPLVAGAELVGLLALARLEGVVHAARDVGRLLLDGGQRPARLPVEADARIGVPDVAHGAPHDLLDVDPVAGADLAEHEHEPGRRRHLDGAASDGVMGQDVVQDGIGDRVAQLVRMALGDRLGGEQRRGHGVWHRSSVRMGVGARRECSAVRHARRPRPPPGRRARSARPRPAS